MSTIETPLDLFNRLFEPFDPSLKKTKRQGGQSITFVEWTSYIARAWNEFPEGFSTEIRKVAGCGTIWTDDDGEVVDDRQVVVVVRVTDNATGIYQEATGAAPASKDKSTWGGALPEAESQALRRAFAKFGLGLEMYLDDDTFNTFAGSPEPDEEEEEGVTEMTESQIARLRGLAIVLEEHGHEDVIDGAREAIAEARDQKAKAGVVIRKIKEFLDEEGLGWEDPS